MASIQTTRQHDKRQGFHSDTVATALNARHRVPLRQIEATRLTKTNTSDVDAGVLARSCGATCVARCALTTVAVPSMPLMAHYCQVPIGIVLPRDVDDIVATVATARRYGAPVLARGGGTSSAGQCCNVAVVLDMSKYLHHILALDPDGKRARIQPGVVLDDLRNVLQSSII